MRAKSRGEEMVVATAIIVTLLSAALYGLSEMNMVAPSAPRRTRGYFDDFEA
jgi:hypothetical protein